MSHWTVLTLLSVGLVGCGAYQPFGFQDSESKQKDLNAPQAGRIFVNESQLPYPTFSEPPPQYNVSLGKPRAVFRSITQAGHSYYPDTSVSIIKAGSGIEVYVPGHSRTWRLTGTGLFNLSLSSNQAVLSPTQNAATPDQKYIGSGNVFRCGGETVSIGHAENHVHLSPFAQGCQVQRAIGVMVRATSSNKGQSFSKSSPYTVMTSSHEINPLQQAHMRRCFFGAAAGSILRINDTMLMYYHDFNNPKRGLHIAAANFNQCGVGASWKKFYDGKFQTETLADKYFQSSGMSTPVVVRDQLEGKYDLFPVVTRNTYLNAFLMVAATEVGVAFRLSRDGINWGPRKHLFFHSHLDKGNQGQVRILYPTVFDKDTLSRDVTGRDLYLVYGLERDDRGKRADHRAYAVRVRLDRQDLAEDSFQLPDGLVTLTQYKQKTSFELATLERKPAGYQVEKRLGQIASNSIRGTVPLYSCKKRSDSKVNLATHIASRDPDCEGGTFQSLLGHIFTNQNVRTGLSPLWRCRMDINANIANVKREYEEVGRCRQGHQQLRIIGYVLNGTITPRPPAPAPPAPTPPTTNPPAPTPPAPPRLPASQETVNVYRQFNPVTFDHAATARRALIGYLNKGVQFKAFKSASTDRIGLFDCRYWIGPQANNPVNQGNKVNHVAKHSSCGSFDGERVGYLYKQNGPNRTAIYRCYIQHKYNHFLTKDPSTCTSNPKYTLENILGYAPN